MDKLCATPVHALPERNKFEFEQNYFFKQYLDPQPMENFGGNISVIQVI